MRLFLILMKCSNYNECLFVCTLGGVPACQRLKMLSRRPAKSVGSWAKLWDPRYWSERRRQGSGGMRMRRMQAEANMLHPCLTFHVFPQSLPLHGCPCPSASETEAGKNSEDIFHWLMKPKSWSSQFKLFYCLVVMAELKCSFQRFFFFFLTSANTKTTSKKTT